MSRAGSKLTIVLWSYCLYIIEVDNTWIFLICAEHNIPKAQNMYYLVALTKVLHCIWQISQCIGLQEVLKCLRLHLRILLVIKIASNISLSISAIVLIESLLSRQLP